MTGQEQVIALRRTGRSPRTVWVYDDVMVDFRDGLTVCLLPQDVPEQQDWRFLIGLNAFISGEDEARLTRITAACTPIAKRVIAHLHSALPNVDDFGRETFPLLKITDTAGVFTWQA